MPTGVYDHSTNKPAVYSAAERQARRERMSKLQSMRKIPKLPVEHYITIGSKGGKAPHPGGRGFQLMEHDQIAEIGRKGGAISRRGKSGIIKIAANA
jgi:hypothetical protein